VTIVPTLLALLLFSAAKVGRHNELCGVSACGGTTAPDLTPVSIGRLGNTGATAGSKTANERRPQQVVDTHSDLRFRTFRR